MFEAFLTLVYGISISGFCAMIVSRLGSSRAMSGVTLVVFFGGCGITLVLAGVKFATWVLT